MVQGYARARDSDHDIPHADFLDAEQRVYAKSRERTLTLSGPFN